MSTNTPVSSNVACLDVIRACIAARVPVLVWGDPGTGKTAAIGTVAAELGCWYEVVVASLREPSDFAGMPIVGPDGVRLEAPAWAKRLNAHGRAILMLDEASCAPPSVQAALLRVVDERVVGDLALSRDVSVVAAANPMESAAGGWDLSAAAANRWLHVTWTGWSAQEWAEWAVGQGWGDAGALTAAYLCAHSTALHQMPADASARGGPWASRRSWARACQVLSMLSSSGVPMRSDTATAIVAAAVGPQAALAWATYVREVDLPDPEALLADPSKLVLPPRGDQILATLASVTAAVLARCTAARWQAGFKVLARAAEMGAAGQAAIPARSLGKARPSGATVPVELRAFLPVLQAAGLVGGAA